MKHMKTLANNIRSLRKKLGYTQSSLGTICGVSGAAVSQWESRESPTMPDIGNLLAMSKAFKVTVEQLVEEVDAQPKYSLDKELDVKAFEKVFNLLTKTAHLDLLINQTTDLHKANLFCLLYSLCANTDGNKLGKADIDNLISIPLSDN